MTAKLYLIPNRLSSEPLKNVMPSSNFELVKKLKYFIIEKPKPAHAFLRDAGIKTPFKGINLLELNKHTSESEKFKLIEPLKNGFDVGLLTDAGYPVIADPGEFVVQLAHENGFEVIPLVGPSSILMALVASGLNAENFCFNGYIPVKQSQRIQAIIKLERKLKESGFTQIFIETPYRTQAVFNDLLKNCNNQTLLALGIDITSRNEYHKCMTIFEWKKQNIELHKRQVVFLIGKPKLDLI